MGHASDRRPTIVGVVGEELELSLPQWLIERDEVLHVHRRPRSPGTTAPWPAWVGTDIIDALARRGVENLWAHQSMAADAAFHGRHVALATGTASGKTLSYLLPILAAGVDNRVGVQIAPRARGLSLPQRHTALYLAPTKALAHDQARVCRELGLGGWRFGTVDGDSDVEERRFARDHASFVLTNPDMLHRSILPGHTRWTRLLGGLRYIVVDEAHHYRGVFGSHVSAVLRRLRRLAAHYGADPVVTCVSATLTNAGEVARALTGVDEVTVVDADASPRVGVDIALWEATSDLTRTAAGLLARFATDGQALAFTTSRVQAELVALAASDLAPDPGRIAAYRGGYLAEDRRELEDALATGRLAGVACTSALELGVDIPGVDAVISAGFPGTLAAWWQQIGRAGRAGRDATAVLVARADPLDAYLVSHPDALFDRPIEQTVVHPDNPYILAPHLAAAAQELPLSAADARWFGPETTALADQLAAQGALRRRASAWYWTRPERAVDAIDLRSIQGKVCEVVEAGTGRVVGEVDPSAADRTLHPGAIYVHQGEQWLIRSFDETDRVALASRTEPTYFTQPQSVRDVRILQTRASREWGLATLRHGMVELGSQVVGYLRRDLVTGEVWDATPLELPQRRLVTAATWWTLPPETCESLGLAPQALAGAAHAAEHTAIGLLPAFVPCDRWDVGGLSTLHHPDTGTLTVFVHDGHPGGAGFAERGFALADAWWQAVAERLATCPCEEGCPACIVSPKCGSGNAPLDKAGAAALVSLLISGHQ